MKRREAFVSLLKKVTKDYVDIKKQRAMQEGP